MQSDTEPRHVEFPQQVVQHSIMNEAFYQDDRTRIYGNDSNALMMMQKEIPQQREESDYRQLPGTSVLTAKTFLDDRTSSQAVPRLPFPTRAFPSETMGMPNSGLLGSSFHPLTHLSSHRYYDSATSAGSDEMATSSSPMYASAGSSASAQVSYSSYVRGGESNVHVTSYQPTTTTTTFLSKSDELYTQSMRQEDLDRHYESSSPHDVRRQESRPQQTQAQAQPGYGGNPVAPEFTGEELSAVLELMKDS
ncbi:unnamed protein product [Peronospora belbahrii]|nr:unnamed protein product [Peronospora belbahrii]